MCSSDLDVLRFTSKHLPQLGVVDDVIEEPLGGAHRDHHQIASRLKGYLAKTLDSLVQQDVDGLISSRYEKFRKMGSYLEQFEDGSLQQIGHAFTS